MQLSQSQGPKSIWPSTCARTTARPLRVAQPWTTVIGMDMDDAATTHQCIHGCGALGA